jgi:hypothetical protein
MMMMMMMCHARSVTEQQHNSVMNVCLLRGNCPIAKTQAAYTRHQRQLAWLPNKPGMLALLGMSALQQQHPNRHGCCCRCTWLHSLSTPPNPIP